MDVALRFAQQDDARLLWEWANDPLVRASAFSSDPIPWEDHVAWFAKKMADPGCVIYIGSDSDGVAIGQVRFDRVDDDVAEIDVHLAPDQRGRGYGPHILDAAVRAFFDATDAQAVWSVVKKENSASAGAFRAAGFTEQGEETLHNLPVIVFIRTRA